MRELKRDYGVRLEWFSRGCSVHRYGRPPLLGGLGLTRPLLTYLRRAGVRVIEGTVVTAIIRDGDAPARGQVRGVVAVVPDSGQTIHLAAGAVVVATGGGGAIYGRTDNPPRMTGDGYALLAQAGASLEDMEFVQFYPLGVAEPGLPARLLDTSLLDLARLTDENGDEPLAGRLEEWGFSSGAEINLYARARAARATKPAEARAKSISRARRKSARLGVATSAARRPSSSRPESAARSPASVRTGPRCRSHRA
jgi:succinate dehydrogenase/fumarate reductase flavoprotein subunit